MSLSSFDKRLLADGLGFFERPRLATLLELLGDARYERVDTLATMLRHCPPNEFDEVVDVFERALARASRDRMRGRDDDTDAPTGEPRRRRYSAAAERREQRRRTSSEPARDLALILSGRVSKMNAGAVRGGRRR